MNYIEQLKNKIFDGYNITKSDALKLVDEPYDELCKNANEIRQHFCGNKFDICTIINAKSGKCSENCKYCAQSAHYKTKCEEYPLLSDDRIISEGQYNCDNGVQRYSMVTSGRALSDNEVDRICNVAKKMKDIPIKLCGSFGLLNEQQYKKLYDAGIKRVHNNLETSKNYFPNMCTTHNFDDKVNAIKNAQSAGMNICSGGIIGLGESFADRIDMAFSLKELGVKSIPMNLLNPIEGTPFYSNKLTSEEEFIRTIAIFRFILPDSFIRLAGGRGLLEDKGYSCFKSGANATITGDLLTTAGISIKEDISTIKKMGYDL